MQKSDVKFQSTYNKNRDPNKFKQKMNANLLHKNYN